MRENLASITEMNCLGCSNNKLMKVKSMLQMFKWGWYLKR
jgi:hypothetical protein